MRKFLLLIFLLPALFSSITVISTEKDFVLDEEEKYHLQALRMDAIMTASRQILMFMKKLLHLQILF